eukprot:Tbor_TRINITY_DN4896_c0_g1::TRINITY_DN4896_c0_g1_i1::g.1280::m.1280
MSVKVARNRTESMAQRLAKKPIAEGFELWDRGFLLGALRLFIFKAESAPPFQLGPCLDAVASILFFMNEIEDAAENFGFAADKYSLIQQPILSKIMQVRVEECLNGIDIALSKATSLLEEVDKDRKAHELTCPKTRSAIARAYYTHAELITRIENGDLNLALKNAQYSVEIGWDRVHMAHSLIGHIMLTLGETEGSIAAYERAANVNDKYLHPLVKMALILKDTKPEKAMELLNQAIEVHPRSALIREKAYMMSDKSVVDAVAFLDNIIDVPPVEETENGVSSKADTLATLHKAKAAILADGGHMAEAMTAVEAALEVCPGDEEAANMKADIASSS